MNIKSFFKGTLQIVAFATFISVAATSCADDSMTTTAKGESSKAEFAGLAKSTLQVSLGGGVQLDPATRSLDSDGAETRSVLIKRNGTKYTPIVEGDQMEARIFIVQETVKRVEGGKEVFYTVGGTVVGAGKVTFQAKQLPDGSISLYYPGNTIDFSWVSNSVVPRPGEKWYICGIIGGEYKNEYDAVRKNKKLSGEERYKAELKYNFYVDFDPNSSPKHNQMDANGNVQVAAPYTTGWVKMDIEKDGVINKRSLKFKPIGTLLHFRVKRDPSLVPAKACRYTFASSQLSANGGFLMMPQRLFHSGDSLQKDLDMGVDCRVRPWENNSIENNFCWKHYDDRQLHMNNTSSDINSEETGWGVPLYEYRYTFDAQKMRGDNPKDGYDDFYVWGMPIPYNKYIGQTMLTAERGGYMLGRKQPDGAKYPYADEWLYASGTPALASGEYKVLDFRAANKKNKAYSVELGVCRPRYSEMVDNEPKYPWANPLERVAVTNSMTEQVGFHTDNNQYWDYKNWGKIANRTLKSAEFKMKFVYNRPLLPVGYHVPNNEEFGAIFPNNITSLSEKSLPVNFEKYSDIKKDGTPYLELYDPGDDDLREMIVAGEGNNTRLEHLWEHLHWATKPLFYAYYAENPNNNQEFYAIRFMGDNPQAVSSNRTLKFGNRYRCVYRWRLMNLGSGQADADDKILVNNKETGVGRIVVQSRWIGNANVSIRDITNEQWWGKCSSENPLYNVDCYRVLPTTGYPYGRTTWDWTVNFWTRTYWGYDTYSTDVTSQNITFCYRSYKKSGFSRGHNEVNQAYYGVRLICQRTQDEFGQNAPRQNQRDNMQADLIKRPADARVSKWEYVPAKK